MTSLEVLLKGQVYHVHRRQLHVGLQRLRGRAQLEEAGTAEAPGVADVAALTVADADAVQGKQIDDDGFHEKTN